MAKATLVLLVLSLIEGCGEPRYAGERVHLADPIRVFNRDQAHADWYRHVYAVLSRSFDFALKDGETIFFNGTTGAAPTIAELRGPCDWPYCRNATGYRIDCIGDHLDEGCASAFGYLYGDLMGVKPAFIRTGLADLLAGGMAYAQDEDPSLDRALDVRLLTDDSAFAAQMSIGTPTERMQIRMTAADFVRFLVDRADPISATRFWNTTDLGDNAWQRTFGDTFEGIVAEWRALPAARGRLYRWNEPECAAPPLPSVAPSTFEDAVDLATTATPPIHIWGLLTAVGPRSMVHSIDVPTATSVHAELRSSLPVLAFERCGSRLLESTLSAGPRIFRSPRGIGAVAVSAQNVDGVLEPGRYAVFALGRGLLDTRISLRVELQQ